jgi:RNA polymerase sigma-70 factor, ECF subfamily
VEVTLQEPEPRTVAAAKRGDIAAFETIVRMYQPYVWRLSVHLMGEEHIASDITQNTFIKVYRSLKRFKGESKFSTWLIAVARNCVHDELRSRARRTRLAEAARAEYGTERPSSDQRTAIEVRDALARLPLELREPVVLIDMFGFSYREVAATLKMREGTVKSRVHRARAALIEILTDPQEDAHEG